MSLRARLTLWYGMFLAGVLGLSLVTAYLFHVGSHNEDVDHMLEDVAARAAGEARAGLGERVSLDGLNVVASEPYAVWIFDADAQLPAAETGDLTERSFALVDILELPNGPSSTNTAVGRVRALVLPIADTTARVIALASMRALDESTDELRGTLARLGLAGVIFGAAGAWTIAGGAMRPVVHLTETAEAISRSRDLSRRVPVPDEATDELARLSRTFNEMIASIERSSTAQQAFVTDASHELRTPLTTIRANLDLLAATGERDEQRRIIAQVARESWRLSRLVGDLLLLARADGAPQPLAARPIELDELLMEVFEENRTIPGARLSVTALEQAGVSGERDRIKEVVLALLDNARRYTPADGRIELSLRADDRRAILHVDDTGIGISSADAARAFDRFWRGHQAKAIDATGSGLGLAIARWIVERHGGEIAIGPRREGGTRVEVALPVRGTASRAAGPAAAA